MLLRAPVALALLAVALLAVAGGRAQTEPDLAAQVADLRTRVAVLESRLGTRPLATVTPDVLHFDGEGDAVSAPVPLREGLIVAHLEGRGDGELAVTLYDAAGGRVAFGARPLPYSGTLADRVPASGPYVVAVESGGAWRVVLEQAPDGQAPASPAP
jgi:hypothetical protein